MRKNKKKLNLKMANVNAESLFFIVHANKYVNKCFI